jgi:hypothetical protein
VLCKECPECVADGMAPHLVRRQNVESGALPSTRSASRSHETLGNQRSRERGQRRRPRAGEDQKLAGFARASFFFVLQISELTSSLEEASIDHHLAWRPRW